MKKENEQIIFIEKVVIKGKKYFVYTDSQEDEFQFTEDQIVNNRIIKGVSFTSIEWQKILEGLSISTLFEKMLHFIDYKMRTKNEVINKLYTLKAETASINEVINKLIKIGYIDDERYTKMYVEECIRQNKGPYLIKFNLEQKGIEIKIIENELSKINESLEKELALNTANSYKRTINKYPVLKQKEMISQKLSRQGFGMDMINYCLREIVFGEDDLESLTIDYEKLLNKKSDKNKVISSLMQKGYRYEDIKKVLKA